MKRHCPSHSVSPSELGSSLQHRCKDNRFTTLYHSLPSRRGRDAIQWSLSLNHGSSSEMHASSSTRTNGLKPQPAARGDTHVQYTRYPRIRLRTASNHRSGEDTSCFRFLFGASMFYHPCSQWLWSGEIVGFSANAVHAPTVKQLGHR